jgi:hypothetical protein
MEEQKKESNYSLGSVQSFVFDQPDDQSPAISSVVRLEIKERDIRCMKGDCWRDCADCG